MRLMYTGRADTRVVSTADFPHIDFDLDEDVERIEWVWGEGQVVDVPDQVAEWLRTNHRHEFRILEDSESDKIDEIDEDEIEIVEDTPEPSRDELGLELSEKTRDELVAMYDQKGLTFRSKANKEELVEGLLDYYHPISDESASDDPVDPDSEPDSQ